MEFNVTLNIGKLKANNLAALSLALATEDLGEYLDYLQWHGLDVSAEEA
jgi:hypothetical protein